MAAAFSNALNLDYSLYCQGVDCVCDRCGAACDYWDRRETTIDVAAQMDHDGWLYVDWDRILCPTCASRRKRKTVQLPLFDAVGYVGIAATAG
jgi:hypothetical protein